MLEHSVPFCPAHLHNHCQFYLCFEQINDDEMMICTTRNLFIESKLKLV